jgi:hypothetical protein
MCECPLHTLLNVHRLTRAVLLVYDVTFYGLLALLEATHRVLLAVHGEEEVLATHHVPETDAGQNVVPGPDVRSCKSPLRSQDQQTIGTEVGEITPRYGAACYEYRYIENVIISRNGYLRR